jgi:hypothetical protein
VLRNVEVLLQSDDAPLVTRITQDDWNGGQIIVIANGSFTLNYPLVNHEHRKLAARLIEASSSADDRVVFIESDAGGPPIRDKEKATSPPTSLELLKVWPLNAILLHIAVLGLVLLLARAPIFGHVICPVIPLPISASISPLSASYWPPPKIATMLRHA